MSWDSYCDEVISKSSNNCDKVAIIGIDGSVWSSNDGPKRMTVTAEEAQKISLGFQDDSGEFRANGVVVGGVKYDFQRRDENVVHARIDDHGSITMQKSNQAIVIGHTPVGKDVGSTNKGVAHVSEYFGSVGY